MQKIKNLTIFVTAFLTFAAAGIVVGQITVPNTFTPNSTILSSQVNANFAKFSDALNRTGGTMTGTLTTQNIAAASDASYDVGASGTKFRNAYFSATVTANAFSGSGASLTSLPLSGLSPNAAQAWNITGKTANYSAAMGDLVELTSGSSITITLPAASGATAYNYRVGFKNDTANSVTIARSGSDTIDGSTSYTTPGVQYESFDFVVNAAKTGWMIR